ncbi:MAG TPA: hypothetical protein VIJ50_04925 [Solirubrobacteraceae bacterium]
MATEAPTPAGDGFHHPASEQELAALVAYAYNEGLQLRVRGATHSVSHAIYTDPLEDLPNRVSQEAPPSGPNLNVMLDRYRGWRVREEERKLVEAQAGIHLGGDPNDPAGTATVQSSLLWQLWKQKGWMLSDTGGIAHQTVSGFTATGSSGGSLQYSANRNLWGFRYIDGRGEVHEVTREDADSDLFEAMCPNLGLLGVISTITFECVETFDIEGQEATTTIEDCAVDVFGPGAPGRPSLEQFLRDTPFARLEWWPQRGVERMVTWQAVAAPPRPGFQPNPYRRFGEVDPEIAQHLFGIVFTIIGNLDRLSAAKGKLEAGFDELEQVLELLGKKDLGEVGRLLGEVLAKAIEFGVDVAITLLEPAAPLIRRELPRFYPKLVNAFVTLDKDKDDHGPQRFADWAWHGLPMDNSTNDVVLPTEFTEAWLPLSQSRQVMGLLRDYFSEPKDDHEALARTGTYAWELYAVMSERFWLNAAYSGGQDEWSEGTLRIDAYWFAGNAADPTETLYLGFWKLLRDAGIPFRLHWAKFQPSYAPGDRTWVDFFSGQYPRWEDFLRLRAERDPNNIFLTGYWRDRFGLWDQPAPGPQSHLR